MISRPALLTTALALAACNPSKGDTDTDTDADTDTGTDTEGHGTTDMSPTTGEAPVVVELDAPCDFGPDDASELALVTNDFVTPAGLGRVDAGDLAVTADILPATTDTVLGATGDWLVMVHRFGHNRIDVVDRAGEWLLRGSVDVTHPASDDPNPQGVTFAADGLAYVPLFAAPAVQIYDFSAADSSTWLQGEIDLSPVADADGSPEAGVALACGGVLFVGVQRLVDFAPVDNSYLVAVDLAARAVLDLDAATEGTQGIALLGPYPKQIRRDPADAAGHTALVLTSGVERVDLSRGTAEWAVAPEVLAEAGIDGFDPQAFVLAQGGASIFLAATDGEFPAAAVFHVGLDGGEPAAPVKVMEGLNSGEKMLERVGGFLWIGDADPADPRVRVYDPATQNELQGDGLKTAVAPWTFIPLP
ncbi:hypothetical protein SAMN02745121_02195 [Nannocystis exedens]|uniref:Uncharacterized protein n=1 Tax=Nannocystis exedens TaxID=54 RepID=A0A1I1W9Z4_9BACT|nr:hypothetical protein [Nannocystis exedens]PCC67558.1 hypothetical protein NAEX_00565 [Nannocystis exedens]SFD91932.1 hypothetical protein SAMN02745121_02195 [Nannocystis exedens]